MQIQLPSPEEVIERARTPPHIMDAAMPWGLPEPMQPEGDFFGFRTPERLRRKTYREPFVPMFDVDFEKLPCDVECSPVAFPGGTSGSGVLDDSPPDLQPPSPPELSPLSPSPPPPPPRGPLRLPVQQRMAPQRLQFTEDVQTPGPPSILIAEPGSPQMLDEMPSWQVYGVEPLDVPFSPREIMDLEGTYA